MLLTICIVTRNRVVLLKETIEAFYAQLTDDVELLVVDGASSDKTPELMAGYIGDSRVRYVRLEENGGIDRDFDKAVRFSRGEYCWLFSDDDVVKQHAIERVLEAVRKDMDVVVVNAEVCDDLVQEVLIPSRVKASTDVNYPVEKFEEFFVAAADHLSFIGALVIRKALWLERNAEKYFGTYFVHVGVLFQQPPVGTCLVIAEPLIRIRYGNASWSSKSFVIWNALWPTLIWSFANFRIEAREKVVLEKPYLSLFNLLKYRALGVYGYAEYLQFVKPQQQKTVDMMVSWLVSVLPGLLLNATILGVVRICFPGRRMALFELRKSKYYWRNVHLRA